MNRDQASTLICQTFTQSFDKSRFLLFVRNLVNHLDESKAIGMLVPDAFTPHIRSCWRLGTYQSPEGEFADVLIVHTTAPHKIERTRAGLRDFVAHKLKRQDSYKEAGLVAFVSPDARAWRFSYIRMDYESKRDPNTGKIKAEERLTPARRFSYIVGEGESCHTAQTRFLDLLQDTKTDPKLADIEEAFSVEAVTKEFFEQYRELFEHIEKALKEIVEEKKAIRDEFTEKNVNTVDFAKKLMGQIVFLYFLQKKGWLGVAKGQDWGTGPHNFLRRLADGECGKYNNFFNDILEPLFYDTLATDRGHEAWCNRFKCRIPFLNGGLFEPLGNYNWQKTDILLPNRLFTNKDFIEEGITGTGVLDVFDRYNFTVNEAEPLEKEVAIDPEMLGKVFENLIEENRRKGLGAYYTPREIVHYMCQESLINYLDTALNKGKEMVPRNDIETFVHLGDQAAHYEAARMSGTKSYKAELPKSIETHARTIDDKLADIAVCDPAVGSGAFLVGMMSEIVRARSALTPYFNDVHERTPYHFKRDAIQNCLYGVDIDPGAVEIAKLRLWLSLVVDEEDVKQIKPLPNLDYKIVVGNSLIRFPYTSLRLDRIETLKQQFFDETDHEKKSSIKFQIDHELQEAFTASKKMLGYEVNFDFQIYFSEIFHRKDGFDAVLGNPPYLSVERVSRAAKDYYSKNYKTFYKRFDVFGLFFELGMTRLVQNGTVAFIVPQQIFNNMSYKKLRDLMLSNKWLHEILYLGDKIFESANNDVCVLFLWKPEVRRIRLVNALDFDNRIVTEVPTDYFHKFNNVLSFSDDLSAHEIFDKIFNSKRWRVREHFDVFQGIVTGNNTVFLPTDEQIKSAGIERQLTHPVLLGRDFEKWLIRRADRQILYIDWETDMKRYPNTMAYLKRFKDDLEGARSAEEKSTPWYCLHRPRVKTQLNRTPKILVQRTRNPRLKTRIVATMDEEGFYGMESIIFLVPKTQSDSLYYLLAILNSAPVNYLFATRFLNVGVKAEYLQNIPIPKADFEQEKELTELVRRILAEKKCDPKADTTALEREIDRLVYELYGLTQEEIAIVEGKT